MLTYNAAKSQVLSEQVCMIAIDSESREELEGREASMLALKAAASAGFANAGQSDQPQIGVVDAATDEVLDGLEAMDPNRPTNGFRAVFKINKRI